MQSPMFVAFLVIALQSAAAPQAPAAAADIASLQWLAGCWTGTMEGREVEEHWMKPAGGTMFGMSRTVAGGKTVAFEFLELRQQGPSLSYTARPSGQPQASFQWVSGDRTSARFENPAHDFPQVVTYTLKSDGSLLARIEGTSRGKPRAVDFPMRRGGC
jgi:hypothetical protein